MTTDDPPKPRPDAVDPRELAGIKVHPSLKVAIAHVSAECQRQHRRVHAKLLKKAADKRDRGT